MQSGHRTKSADRQENTSAAISGNALACWGSQAETIQAPKRLYTVAIRLLEDLCLTSDALPNLSPQNLGRTPPLPCILISANSSTDSVSP